MQLTVNIYNKQPSQENKQDEQGLGTWKVLDLGKIEDKR
jgi:hypothetical protein